MSRFRYQRIDNEINYLIKSIINELYMTDKAFSPDSLMEYLSPQLKDSIYQFEGGILKLICIYGMNYFNIYEGNVIRLKNYMESSYERDLTYWIHQDVMKYGLDKIDSRYVVGVIRE